MHIRPSCAAWELYHLDPASDHHFITQAHHHLFLIYLDETVKSLVVYEQLLLHSSLLQ